MRNTQESQFLDRLYDAAVDPDLWPGVMESLADLLGGAGAWLTRMSVADGSGEGVLARIDPAMATIYDTYYATLNPFSNEPDPAGYMSTWRPEILMEDAWLPRGELERTTYYNEFMRPQGIYSGMIIRLAARGLNVCALTMTRTRQQGRFDADAVVRASRVHGHLRRAFRLTETLAMGGGKLPAGVAEALDGSPHAVMVLSTTGVVQRINARGEALARAGVGLRVAGGRLVLDRADEARRLDALIAAAGARDPALRTAGEMTLPVAEARPPLAISVSPVRSVRTAVFEDGPSVIVCITDPLGAALGPGSEARLTRREHDALTWVAEGKSDWEIGMILGVSETTARFHVDNARKKLGAVNRAQAVARLLGAGRLQ